MLPGLNFDLEEEAWTLGPNSGQPESERRARTTERHAPGERGVVMCMVWHADDR